MSRKKNPTSEMPPSERAKTPLAQRINSLITDANQLKDYLGCSIQAINQFRYGDSRPSLDNLVKIAEFYNVSTDYLLGRTDEPSIRPDVQAACLATGLSGNAMNRILLETSPLPGEIVPESDLRQISVFETLLLSSSFWRTVRLLGGYIKAAKQNRTRAEEIAQEYRLINGYGGNECIDVKDIIAFNAQRAFAALLDELDSNSEEGGE